MLFVHQLLLVIDMAVSTWKWFYMFFGCCSARRLNSLEITKCNNNNNNILYSSMREIKAVVRSYNEEHISVILSHETHAHTHS